MSTRNTSFIRIPAGARACLLRPEPGPFPARASSGRGTISRGCAPRPGESQRHIDWKAVARGQPLLVEQFAGEHDEKIYLDWETLPLLGDEERLSQLALWVIKAERSRCLYGLKIPGLFIPPARGEAHYHRCLGALAVYRRGEAA